MNHYFMAKGVNKPAMVLAVLILAVAASCAWLGYDTGAYRYYWIAGVLAIFASLVPQSIMVADQWERAVVLRLGKLTAIRGPGMFAIVPFIDTVASWLDQRIQTTEIRAARWPVRRSLQHRQSANCPATNSPKKSQGAIATTVGE